MQRQQQLAQSLSGNDADNNYNNAQSLNPFNVTATTTQPIFSGQSLSNSDSYNTTTIEHSSPINNVKNTGNRLLSVNESLASGHLYLSFISDQYSDGSPFFLPGKYIIKPADDDDLAVTPLNINHHDLILTLFNALGDNRLLWCCPIAKVCTLTVSPQSILIYQHTCLMNPTDNTIPLTCNAIQTNQRTPFEATALSLSVGTEEGLLEQQRSPTQQESSCDTLSIIQLRFSTSEECKKFLTIICKATSNSNHLNRTDVSVLQAYFQYYGKMSNQMNMLQDTVRTKIYRDAILANPSDFNGARVMDVGAGTGILSFFAAQCRADTVFVVEASNIATAVSTLALSNPQLGGRLHVLHKTVETIELSRDLDGQKVDVIVSEPIGTFLFNERMLESFLYARDKFLRPGGRMFPSRCRLFLAPFSDSQLYSDMTSRCNFWANQNFYGIKLSAVLPRAVEEQFKQPVVDYVDPASIVCHSWHQEEFDLSTISRESLAEMEFKFRFPITSPCLIHGIAGWFDVMFDGTDRQLGFSTAPWCPPTHWYQIRFVFRQPLAVNMQQTVVGTLKMIANSQQSYYITVVATIEGCGISTSTAVIDLKDPDYRYYSNPQASYVPPTTSTAANNIVDDNTLINNTSNPFAKATMSP